jgi:predicted dithiol-disulfide oxidoreductase (DUF899 family)
MVGGEVTGSVDARLEALQREIEAARRELVLLLKERARGPVDDAVLAGPGGPVRLSELFGEHQELIVSFNMGRQCRYCSLWADAANGVLRHIEQQAAFVVVSPDPVDVQAQVALERGWRFRMVSHRGTTFARDMGFAVLADGEERWWPGLATFRRVSTGSGIERVGADVYGPGDPYCSVYHMFALLDSGGEEFVPQL